MIARGASVILALMLAASCGATGRAAASPSHTTATVASPSATPLIDVNDMMGAFPPATFFVSTNDGIRAIALLNHATRYTIPTSGTVRDDDERPRPEGDVRRERGAWAVVPVAFERQEVKLGAVEFPRRQVPRQVRARLHQIELAVATDELVHRQVVVHVRQVDVEDLVAKERQGAERVERVGGDHAHDVPVRGDRAHRAVERRQGIVGE